jgi:hypothetical protein
MYTGKLRLSFGGENLTEAEILHPFSLGKLGWIYEIGLIIRLDLPPLLRSWN